jgi:hypothetical protein
MKHAGSETLDRLAPLLDRLRLVPGLVERKRGTFYFRSMAFVHFHEDPAGVFVDVKLNGPSFERLPVSTAADRAVLIKAVAGAVAKLQETRTTSRRA